MIVQATQVPDFSDLLQTLKSQFPGYSVYAFDSKPQESIIVRKSGVVGAQISLHKDEIIVDACCPNIFVSALIGLISAILPPSSLRNKDYRFLEKKVHPGSLLRTKRFNILHQHLEIGNSEEHGFHKKTGVNNPGSYSFTSTPSASSSYHAWSLLGSSWPSSRALG